MRRSPISPRRRVISSAPRKPATTTRAYSYGVLLREGKGVALDTAASAHWLKRAADAGIVAGQVEYAIMLFNGVGVERDEADAAKIFKLAAARSNPIAQNRLAHLYLTGRGVPKDLVQAALGTVSPKPPAIEDPELDSRDRASVRRTAKQSTTRSDTRWSFERVFTIAAQAGI